MCYRGRDHGSIRKRYETAIPSSSAVLNIYKPPIIISLTINNVQHTTRDYSDSSSKTDSHHAEEQNVGSVMEIVVVTLASQPY